MHYFGIPRPIQKIKAYKILPQFFLVIPIKYSIAEMLIDIPYSKSNFSDLGLRWGFKTHRMCLFAVVQEHGGKLASVKMDNVQSNVVFIYMNHPELMNSEQFVQRMMQVKNNDIWDDVGHVD